VALVEALTVQPGKACGADPPVLGQGRIDLEERGTLEIKVAHGGGDMAGRPERLSPFGAETEGIAVVDDDADGGVRRRVRRGAEKAEELQEMRDGK